jgi:hypothetical protein
MTLMEGHRFFGENQNQDLWRGGTGEAEEIGCGKLVCIGTGICLLECMAKWQSGSHLLFC